MTWPVLLSDLGGFISILAIVFQLLATYMNENKWMIKQIRQMFYGFDFTDKEGFKKIKLKYTDVMRNTGWLNKQENC